MIFRHLHYISFTTGYYIIPHAPLKGQSISGPATSMGCGSLSRAKAEAVLEERERAVQAREKEMAVQVRPSLRTGITGQAAASFTHGVFVCT